MSTVTVQDYFRRYQFPIIFGSVVAVIVLALITWLSHRPSDNDVKVSLGHATVSDITAVVEAAGIIGSESDKIFTASSAGKWQSQGDVTVGMPVKSGRILGRVFNQKLFQDFEAEKIDHNFTLVEHKNLAREYELNKSLFKQKAISQKDLDTSKLALDKHKLQTLVSSQKKMAEALKAIADASVAAPFSGTIVEVLVRPDQVINASDKLLRISDLRSLKAVLYVSEFDFPKIKSGQAVVIHDGFLGSNRIKATVGNIESVAKEVNNVRKITVHCPIDLSSIPNHVQLVMDGSVQGDFLLDHKSKVIAIPKTAVVVDGGHTYVFVEQNHVAHKTLISIGLEGKTTVEVRSGLSIKDNLITAGQLTLSDDQPVSVLDAQSNKEQSHELF